MSDWKLISTVNPSGAANVEFTALTGYKIFKFVFIDVNPATNNVTMQFDGSISGTYGSTTKTSTYFRAYNNEAGDNAAVIYTPSMDLAQSTNDQPLMSSLGNASDESGAGELILFNPASTVCVKHFYGRFQEHSESPSYAYDSYPAGYLNTTSAIDGIKFLMSSGNFDGTIKQYGLVAG